MKIVAFGILCYVIFQRLTELLVAKKNTKQLLISGAKEYYPEHYWFFILLHTAWLVSICYFLVVSPDPISINWILLGLFIIVQGLRYWTLATLGKFFTTRIISDSNQPLITHGPYRYFRHPNYAIVVAEIALLPGIFNFWYLSAVFSLFNGILLAFRIHKENNVLASRT